MIHVVLELYGKVIIFRLYMASKGFQGLYSPNDVVSTNNLLRIEQDQCKIKMTRLYYSSIFKAFYSLLIILSALCILVNLLQFYEHSKLVVSIEVFLTILLAFEVLYRMYMLGFRVFFEHKWNILDVFVVFFSVLLLWVGIELGGGVGDIDTVTAVLFIIGRNFIMAYRLVSFIKKKKDQEVQIIDLNDMSEMDEDEKGKEKKFKKFSENKLEEHKNEYQESQVEV